MNEQKLEITDADREWTHEFALGMVRPLWLPPEWAPKDKHIMMALLHPANPNIPSDKATVTYAAGRLGADTVIDNRDPIDSAVKMIAWMPLPDSDIVKYFTGKEKDPS